eukprot:TRINITY_DN5805_c0_g1_i2.p1 TRINITY_DN5805_c0_g1~~TRINITY_DN5805_c0_g1_i2.p1  ORF type:complete len:285 (-),score=48.00 TRINITY_DN5805_c0_g1_i2:7-861(-)
MTLTPFQTAFDMLAMGYIPDKTLASISIVLMFICCVVVFINAIRTKTYLLLIISATALTECAGYIARVVMCMNPSREAYIALQVLLILSPNAFALVNYWTVGLIVQRASNGGTVKGAMSWISPKTISAIFLTSDFVSFGVQGTAAGLLVSNDPETSDHGRLVMMAGLAIQMVFFSIFAIVTIVTHQSTGFGLKENKQVRPAFLMLYVTASFLTIRSIYRFAEFAQRKSYLVDHEIFFYLFDTLVVLGCLITYIFTPLGECLHYDIDYKPPAQKETELVKVTDMA